MKVRDGWASLDTDSPLSKELLDAMIMCRASDALASGYPGQEVEINNESVALKKVGEAVGPSVGDTVGAWEVGVGVGATEVGDGVG